MGVRGGSASESEAGRLRIVGIVGGEAQGRRQVQDVAPGVGRGQGRRQRRRRDVPVTVGGVDGDREGGTGGLVRRRIRRLLATGSAADGVRRFAGQIGFAGKNGQHPVRRAGDDGNVGYRSRRQ